MAAVLHREDRRRQRRHRREDRPHPGRPRPGPQARRRHEQEHLPDRQAATSTTTGSQVINQYEVGAEVATHANRYDVTILVNGLPLVHVELKRRGVDIREAFNQINRYQRDSFWAGSGLFEYVQLFVISNGTLTKYYSNTTRDQHVGEAAGRQARQAPDVEQLRVHQLVGRCQEPADHRPDRLHQDVLRQAHPAQHPDEVLRVRRRPQAAGDAALPDRRRRADPAAHRDLHQPASSSARVAAGGYVWHTTGSGKTLTSFKAAQLASRLPRIDKVLFVVDRKDLDYQTMREYERFEKGAANSNTSTARPASGSSDDPGARIIITTIQKLARFVEGQQGPRDLRRARRADLRRVPPQPVRRHARRDHQGVQAVPPVRLHRHARSSPRTPERAATRSCAPPSRRSATSCTPTRSSTRSATRTCCRSASTTSTRSRPAPTHRRQEGARDRHRAGSAGAGAARPGRRLRPRPLRPEDPARVGATAWGTSASPGFNSLFATASIDAAKRYYDGVQARAGRAGRGGPGVPAAQDRD